jgi:hypothetical protein
MKSVACCLGFFLCVASFETTRMNMKFIVMVFVYCTGCKTRMMRCACHLGFLCVLQAKKLT